jgi:hypothetical protein
LASRLDIPEKNCRKRPVYSIITKNDNCSVFPTFHSMVLPIEAKKDMNRAIFQSLEYLLQKLRFQLEFNREDPVSNVFGYAMGTDGCQVNLVKVEIKNNKKKLIGNPLTFARLFSPLADLKVDEPVFPANSQLDQYSGIIAILALLTKPPSALGHSSSHKADAFGIPGVEAKELLGMGSFGTAVLVTKDNKFAALKIPLFSKIDGIRLSGFEQRYKKEYAILTEIAKVPQAKDYIPHVRETFDLQCGLLFEEVGISLVDFVSEYYTTTETRYAFAEALRKTLRNVCTWIHDATTITHRDIRPANIIMKYRRLDNNVVPGENNESLQSEYSIFKPSSTQTMSSTASNVEFGEFSPVLIDFGLADYQRIDYKANYSYDFSHDAIVTACINNPESSGRPEIIPYKIDYDLASVDYVYAAVKYAEMQLQPPWRPPVKDFIALRKEMLDSAIAGGDLVRKKRWVVIVSNFFSCEF